MSLIDQRLCGAAIDACDTSAFEQFVQAFHAALVGPSFVPLGGMHDGGADGFEEPLFESTTRVGTFLQASKTFDISGKVNDTIKRLRSFGRDPKVIIFYFSEPYSKVDQLEETVSVAEDITIRIRPKQFIEAHINDSPQMAQAFSSYLRPAVAHLLTLGASARDREFPFEAKTLCAFLGQEVNRRRGNATLLTSVTDSLILWSLEGTDPALGKFMSRDEILSRIEHAIPTAQRFIRSTIDVRLEVLRSKNNPNGREISWYRTENVYALRHDEREKLIEDNAEEIGLFNDVSDAIRENCREAVPPELHNRVSDLAEVVQRCVDVLFEKQGVALSLYIVDQQEDVLENIDIAPDIETLVDQLGLAPRHRAVAQRAVAQTLRKLIYAPTELERDYLRRLSSTYFLLFSLRNEPKIVEYFNSLAEQLIIYVGSDLIIKALSEYHVSPEGQMITNTFKVIRSAGSTLIMTEAALEEVFTHLHAAVLEFENYYADIEPIVDEDFIHLIDRILIRAYFYARIGTNVAGRRPAGWRSYIGQFCNYDDVRRKRSLEGLRLYLCDRFGFEFETKAKMVASVDAQELDALKSAIEDQRGGFHKGANSELLAYNDALHALRVHAKRREVSENAAPNPFGYRTWWLTHEKAVQRAAVACLGPYRPRFIMRPEFLLNYIALMPSKREVSESYRAIFPTVLGVTLSRRADQGLLHTVLASAREAFTIDNSRAKAMLNEFVDQLKADQLRIYEHKIS